MKKMLPGKYWSDCSFWDAGPPSERNRTWSSFGIQRHKRSPGIVWCLTVRAVDYLLPWDRVWRLRTYPVLLNVLTLLHLSAGTTAGLDQPQRLSAPSRVEGPSLKKRKRGPRSSVPFLWKGPSRLQDHTGPTISWLCDSSMLFNISEPYFLLQKILTNNYRSQWDKAGKTCSPWKHSINSSDFVVMMIIWEIKLFHLILSLYRWENWGPEWARDLSKITEQVGKSGTRTQVSVS